MKNSSTTNYIILGNYFDKEYLIKVFNQNKSKLQLLTSYLESNILIERNYYEIYFSYKDGKHLFDTPPCREYQFVYMPPGYEMAIHKDKSIIKSRIGSLLQGSGDILFYDDEDNIIDYYNYDKDILTDTQIKHNVINNNEWRLTFFANFEEPVDVINTKLQYSK